MDFLNKLFGKKQGTTASSSKAIIDRGAWKLNNEGNDAFLTGDLDTALEKYRKALVLDEEEEDLWGKSANLSNIGLIYISKGETELAVENLQASHEILRQLGLDKERAILQYHLGWAYSGNNPQLSKQAFQEALSLSTKENNQELVERINSILKAINENGQFSLENKVAFQVKNSKWRLQPSLITEGMIFSMK